MSGTVVQEVDVRTAVYRFFGADNELLYVGITSDLVTRWRWHQANSSWWHSQARIEVVWHQTRAEAEREETDAVRLEHAVHNIQKRGATPLRTIRVDPELWDEFGEWAKDFPGGASGTLRACMRYLLAKPGAELPQQRTETEAES